MDGPEGPAPRVREGALIAASIVAAAVILSWGMSNSAPRYELAGAGSSVVRMDTDSGELIACSDRGCRRIEAPDRAKRFGPVGIQIGRDEEPAQLPANKQ